MSDISVSERRLSAALDRIDRILEAGGGRRSAEGGPAPDELTAVQERLDAANDQIAALARANDALTNANRALIDGEDVGEDGVRRALEAEISALRAARGAEITQLGELMAELERYLGNAGSAAPVTPEVIGDAGGLPEADDDAGAGTGDAQEEGR